MYEYLNISKISLMQLCLYLLYTHCIVLEAKVFFGGYKIELLKSLDVNSSDSRSIFSIVVQS